MAVRSEGGEREMVVVEVSWANSVKISSSSRISSAVWLDKGMSAIVAGAVVWMVPKSVEGDGGPGSGSIEEAGEMDRSDVVENKEVVDVQAEEEEGVLCLR